MTRALVAVIRLYQHVSHALTACGFGLFSLSGCRQWPTCSEYGIIALQEHGAARGSLKAAVRILRCNPLSCHYVH